MAHPFRVYAHRGASALLPENTLGAFTRALADGADALETDVHLTRDGHVVVHHDATGERTAGVSDKIVDLSLSDVRRWDAGHYMGLAGHGVPTLAELLEAFPGVPINVDIKAPGKRVVREVVRVVTRAGASDRVTLTSVEDRTCKTIVALAYPGAVGIGRVAGLLAAVAPTFISKRVRPLGSALQIPWRYRGVRFDRPSVVARAHALGLRLDYWTIDEPELARRIVLLGADGIMTNDPARVVAAIRSARAERSG